MFCSGVFQSIESVVQCSNDTQLYLNTIVNGNWPLWIAQNLSCDCHWVIAALQRPFGPPSRAPYPYREIKETHELIFSCCCGQWYFSWVPTHDDSDDGGVAQCGGHTPNSRLIETYCSGLPCTFLIYDMLWSIDTCQIKLCADQDYETISRAQVYSSSRWLVLLKLTADQVLDFDWIAGSCQVNLLKTEPRSLEAC